MLFIAIFFPTHENIKLFFEFSYILATQNELYCLYEKVTFQTFRLLFS